MKNFLFFAFLILILVLLNMPAQFSLFGRNFYRPVIRFSMGTSEFFRDLNFRLGLDLRGGTHLVYEADMSKIEESDRITALKSVQNNIERRVNLLGVSESIVQTSVGNNSHRLLVEMPGVKDVARAQAVIGATAQLEFRESIVATPSAISDFIPTGLSGADLRLASIAFGNGNQISANPSINLEFTPDGAKKFSDITARNIGKPLAIFLDNELVNTPPIVQTQIPDGRAVISGNFTLDEAKAVVVQLNAGALPVPIKIIEQRTVGATLGDESIAKSLVAGIIGIVLIWLFMLGNYGFKGLIANIALLFYVLISLSIFKLLPVTLTLSGIAGFILSIGMAVDANILIFERIKEEVSWGRPHFAALELGFHRAWTSIRDSSVSSLITATILFSLGSGSVRGFALTLIIGILVSLFTSITITKNLIKTLTK